MEKTINTYEEAKRYRLMPSDIVDAASTIVRYWLRERTLENFSREECDRILATAVGAHYLAEGRMNVVISVNTIRSVSEQFLNPKLRHSYRDILLFLTQELPRNETKYVKRREWFRQAKLDLGNMRNAATAMQLAEMVYMLLAIMEDREIGGFSTTVM